MAAIIKGNARQTTSVSRVSEGAEQYLRLLRDGTVGITDLIALWSLEGKVFCANAGTATGPVGFGVSNIDTTEPDLLIVVPSGTTIIPIELRIKMEAYGSTALFEAMAAIGKGGAKIASGDTAVVPTNLNTSSGLLSSCDVRCASTAGATYMTSKVSEFWRDGLQKSVTTATADDDQAHKPETFVWRLKESGYLPICEGAGCLAAFAAAQGGSGFITCIYAEFASSALA